MRITFGLRAHPARWIADAALMAGGFAAANGQIVAALFAVTISLIADHLFFKAVERSRS